MFLHSLYERMAMMGLCFFACHVLVNKDDGVKFFLCSLYKRMRMMGLCFYIACMSGW